MSEAEQLFFNDPLLLLEDAKQSQQESRIHALGKTDEGRMLHITFTFRKKNTLIRVIFARNMHKKSEQTMRKQLKPGGFKNQPQHLLD